MKYLLIILLFFGGCTGLRPVLKDGSCPAGFVKTSDETDFGFSTPYCDCSAKDKFLIIYKEIKYKLATAEPMLCRKNNSYYEDCELVER